jgi:hypothetical protein
MGRVAFLAVLGVTAACGGKAVIDAEDAKGGGGAGAVTSSTTTTSSAGGGGTAFVCPRCSDPEQVGKLDSPELTEVSGLAWEPGGTLYLHNDSGDSARFFRVTAEGSPLTTYELQGATAVDWEDMARGPCTGESGVCVYLGDIGDNGESRTSYAIYRVDAPTTVEMGTHSLPFVTLPFVYPDGSHDAETLFVDLAGNPCVVTKVESGPSTVYCYPPPQQPDFLVTLEAVAMVEPPIGVAMFTGGDFAKGGLFLRTYTNVFFWPPAAELGVMLAQTPCIVPSPPDLQGEAIAWLADPAGFLTTSEGAGSPIHRVRCF